MTDPSSLGPAAFKDHFSHDTRSYSRYRPGYPSALFAYLATLCPRRERAWDCGCGNGQAALGLAAWFPRIDATDPSAAQLAKAVAHPNVAYAQAPAEASGLPERAYDLIVAAQAAHWFDVDAFYAEVRRVAAPEAAIALISYHRPRISPGIDAIVEAFHRETLAPYWPPERAHVDAAYRTLPFPFAEMDPPAFTLRALWPLDRVLGYLGTWSAVKLCRRETGSDPLAPVAQTLAARWGDPARAREVTWPVHLRLGRVFGQRAKEGTAKTFANHGGHERNIGTPISQYAQIEDDRAPQYPQLFSTRCISRIDASENSRPVFIQQARQASRPGIRLCRLRISKCRK